MSYTARTGGGSGGSGSNGVGCMGEVEIAVIEAELAGRGLNDMRIIVGRFRELQSTFLNVLLTIGVKNEQPRGLRGKCEENV